MKLKFLNVLGVIALLLFIVYPVEHYWGDNIYGFFAFSKEDVVQVAENEYRFPKDEPETFSQYMKTQGWTYVDQLGSATIYTKDNVKATCFTSFKEFYGKVIVDYENIDDLELK